MTPQRPTLLNRISSFFSFVEEVFTGGLSEPPDFSNHENHIPSSEKRKNPPLLTHFDQINRASSAHQPAPNEKDISAKKRLGPNNH